MEFYSQKRRKPPGYQLTMPSLTEKDLTDLEFIIEQKLDWVALSFVRKANDIIDLKKRIKDKQQQDKSDRQDRNA